MTQGAAAALADRLDGAWWVPAVPLVRSTTWSLAGGAVSGRIRSSRWSNGGVSVTLAGWHGRVGLDTSGLLLMQGSSPAPLGRVHEVRRHLRRIEVGNLRFDCITATRRDPLRVCDLYGADVLTVDRPRWRRRPMLHVHTDLGDNLTLHLAALTSVLTIRILDRPAERGFT